MRRQSLTLVVMTVAAVMVASCSREIKPDKKGCFMVQDEKLVEMQAVLLETEFTPEGFALNYFKGEPSATVRTGDYLILNGDYKPYALNPYTRRGPRFEQDSSKGSASNAITVGPMKGEKSMLKVRFTSSLPVGVYLLECQEGNATVGFPFRIE